MITRWQSMPTQIQEPGSDSAANMNYDLGTAKPRRNKGREYGGISKLSIL
jgi:hypothetical protein